MLEGTGQTCRMCDQVIASETRPSMEEVRALEDQFCIACLCRLSHWSDDGGREARDIEGDGLRFVKAL